MISTHIRRVAAVGTTMAAVLALGASPAAAKAPGGNYTGMGNCPLTAPAMRDTTNLQVGCVYSVTNAGSFRIGTTDVTLSSPITLQFGVYWPASAPVVDFPDGSSANVYNVVPPANGRTLTAAPIQVAIPGIWNIIPGVTSVFAQVELAGPITRFVPLATGESYPVFVLPIKLRLINAVLGLQCYLGSSSHPLILRPTTGTTNPLPPNVPVTGDPGVIDVQADPHGYGAVVASFAGARLVDNEFAAPGASGCGLGGILNGLVEQAFGLSQAGAGHNAVVFDRTNTSLAIDESLADLTAALAAS
ncbi:hypothetical protein Cs7R123_03980 [Catellatospora sp. TT07R-123]|uniref:hypothetical protein n=1 Tax=Catellatospora sp. TT07R-123 TaxID=2733863 RepID=UPI001AFD6266|nr:hypothetical protein [Catellatospora sp. TT07R-123]GHJ43056.1 hypothetical protein Cs7R123_03980 [Catellatospora sp. TT07R-123]